MSFCQASSPHGQSFLCEKPQVAHACARTTAAATGGGGVVRRDVATRRWRWRRRSVTLRVTHITRARAHVITAHRARHHPPPSPMSPMRARGSGGGAFSFARLLARAVAEAVGLGERRWRLRGMTRALMRALTNRRAPQHSVRV